MRALQRGAALGQRAQGGAYAARIHQRGGGAHWLRLSSAPQKDATLSVECTRRLEPPRPGIEIDEQVGAPAVMLVVGVDEIEPEPTTHKDKARRIAASWSAHASHLGR